MTDMQLVQLLLGSTLVASVVTAIMTAIGWWRQKNLALELASRNEETQGRIEGLKTSLADSLVQRSRQAEFTRFQVENLYGPLAFFVESSARHIDMNNKILTAYDEYFSTRRPQPPEHFDTVAEEKMMTEADGVINSANQHMAVVVENNKESIKILRAGWGWLDIDDYDEANEYLTDVARHAMEFGAGQRLPFPFYIKSAMKNAIGKPSFIRPSFIERIRRKLAEKRGILAGR